MSGEQWSEELNDLKKYYSEYVIGILGSSLYLWQDLLNDIGQVSNDEFEQTLKETQESDKIADTIADNFSRRIITYNSKNDYIGELKQQRRR